MASFFSVPAPLVKFNAHFPLKSYPPIRPRSKPPVSAPTLWIASPDYSSDNVLSRDVECLKWQAYLALRGLKDVCLRWDISPEGCIDNTLPNLHVPIADSRVKSEALAQSEGAEDGELLAAHSIPSWVDAKLGVDSSDDPLEGYISDEARIESRAWVSLLEGVVHAALVVSQPKPSYLYSLLFPTSTSHTSESLQKIILPPPAPLAGYLSFIPPTAGAVRVNNSAIISEYRDAIASLSERLGTDTWFLGSSSPTPLDALAFAYIHRILHSAHITRIEITRRVNLVAWEWRVRWVVRDGFVR